MIFKMLYSKHQASSYFYLSKAAEEIWNVIIFTLELQNMSAVMENVWNCAHKYAGVIYHIQMCACLENSGAFIFFIMKVLQRFLSCSDVCECRR